MKNLILNLVLTVFTSTQALAYAPNAESREMNRALDEITKILDATSSMEKISSPRPMSRRKFTKNKNKFINQTQNELDLVSNLNQVDQESYLINKNKKNFKKVRAVSTKLMKRKRTLRRLARKSGIKTQELKQSLKQAATTESEQRSLNKLLAKAVEAGGYEFVLKEKLEKLINMTYESYLEAAKKVTQTKRSPATSKSLKSDILDDLAFAILLGVSLLFMVVATAILLIVMAIILIAGGSVAALIAPAAIGTGLSIFTLILFS